MNKSSAKENAQEYNNTNHNGENVTHFTEAETASISSSNITTQNEDQLTLTRRTLNLQLRTAAFSFVGFLLVTFSMQSIIFFILSLYLISSSLSNATSNLNTETIMIYIFSYMPESIRTFLTETTVHEWMTDTSFANEWRFLLIYFVPGLTTEQLETLIRQLPRRRQEMLLQPGGFAQMISLPQYLMNSLLRPPNNDEYDQNSILQRSESLNNNNNNNISTNRRALPGGNRDDSNNENDLVWDNESIDSNSTNELSHNNNYLLDWLQDESVIYQAMQEAFQSISTSITQSIQSSVVDSMSNIVNSPLFSRIINTSRNMFIGTVLSTAFYYTSPFFSEAVNTAGRLPSRAITAATTHLTSSLISINRSRQNANFSSLIGPILISSSAFMGVSTGLLYYASARSRRSRSSSSVNPSNKHEEKKDMKS